MSPFVEVSLRTLAGEAQNCHVLLHDYLSEAGRRIGEAFDRPCHRVRLLSDRDHQVYSNPHAQPFRTGERSFTVVFDWVTQWAPGAGRLPALANAPANDEAWPQQSADKLHAGSAYSTSYTRKEWAPSLGMTLKETVTVLATERRLVEGGLPRGLVGAIQRASRCGSIPRLTVADVRNLLFVTERAQFCTGCSMRLAGNMLDVYLRGTGLKPTRRRYSQKSAPRPEAPLYQRLRDARARAREGLLG